ncbi:sigma-70 family RNA polymerase sigma factor [Glaciihabitans sp. UYNi722]|uniref:sigma-70 family RNA polymerase sigma factor n=1 Tax=Glaciihabitans sp. UYNi722 TaxID=3156344 RepID=UPI00339140DE
MYAAAGDHAAFAALYRQLWSEVFRAIECVLRDPAQSEEVAQEVFLEVWQSAARFLASQGSVSAWVATIARRRAIDRVRASEASRRRDHDIGIRDHIAPQDDVVATFERRAMAAEVTQLLDRLPHRDRHLIRLVHLDGMSYAETARIFGVPTGTIKSRLNTAMNALRRDCQTNRV